MELKFILESILFSAQKPMSSKELRDVLATAATVEGASDEVKQLKRTKDDDVLAALEQLTIEHEAAQRSYRLACVAGAWQFVSQPEFGPWLAAFVGNKTRPPRLSQPGLETLAIIAYRQPITRAEIEQIRGVAVDGVMQTLLERGLVAQMGRAEVVGRPMTYGTTEFFLQYFGLAGLENMPEAEELRRLPVTKPEALLTTDPGLATAPPDQQLTMVESDKLNVEGAGNPAPESISAEAEKADEPVTDEPEKTAEPVQETPEPAAEEPPATEEEPPKAEDQTPE